METTLKKTEPAKKVFLIAISSAFTIIGMLSLIFHLSPREFLYALAEFSEHHYLLVSFVCLAIALASYKFYSEHQVSVNRKSGSVNVKNRRKLKTMIGNLQRSINKASYNTQVKFIDKSEIPQLKFEGTEVLKTAEEKQLRQETLETALILGNSYKQKVYIFFRAYGLDMYTLATVWHADNENICIKGGATIPVKSIIKIKL